MDPTGIVPAGGKYLRTRESLDFQCLHDVSGTAQSLLATLAEPSLVHTSSRLGDRGGGLLYKLGELNAPFCSEQLATFESLQTQNANAKLLSVKCSAFRSALRTSAVEHTLLSSGIIIVTGLSLNSSAKKIVIQTPLLI